MPASPAEGVSTLEQLRHFDRRFGERNERVVFAVYHSGAPRQCLDASYAGLFRLQRQLRPVYFTEPASRVCHSRIQYRKTCRIDGEVSQEEIVRTYEYANGQYAVIEPEEIDVLRTESDKAISVDTFVPADAIDPVYLSGTGYYLVPDGPVGQRP